MRKALTLFTIVFLSSIAHGQIYFAPRAAYYFPVNSNWVGNYMSGGSSTGWYVFNAYRVALGNGASVGGAIGFQTSKLFHFEVFFGIHEGKSSSRKFVDTTAMYPNKVVHEMRANLRNTKAGIAAGLTVARGSWTFETSSSVFIGFYNELLLTQNIKSYQYDTLDLENEYSLLQYDGIAPGFSQSFQVGYTFNRYLKTTAGFELAGQYWKPKRGVQGNIRLEYTDEIPQPDPNAQPGDPTKAFVQTYTLNTVGIRFSVILSLPCGDSKPKTESPK